MSPTEWILAFVLVVLVLAWFGIALYILATRCLYELEHRALVRAQSHQGKPELDALFRKLSRSQIESFAASRLAPAELAEALSNEVLARYPERLLERAEGSTRDRLVVGGVRPRVHMLQVQQR